MSKDFSASTSVKTTSKSKGDNSPFTQITKQEAIEAKRIESALATFAKEAANLAKTLQEKEESSLAKMKEAAKEELVSYKERELSGIIKTAQSEAKKRDSELEEAYKKNKKDALENLVNTFFDTKSPIFK